MSTSERATKTQQEKEVELVVRNTYEAIQGFNDRIGCYSIESNNRHPRLSTLQHLHIQMACQCNFMHSKVRDRVKYIYACTISSDEARAYGPDAA